MYSIVSCVCLIAKSKNIGNRNNQFTRLPRKIIKLSTNSQYLRMMQGLKYSILKL